jgi:hypothetical protein
LRLRNRIGGVLSSEARLARVGEACASEEAAGREEEVDEVETVPLGAGLAVDD